MALPAESEIPAPAHEPAILDEAHRASLRFLEAGRQTQELLLQFLEVISWHAWDLHRKALQHADEQYQLAFGLMREIMAASTARDVLDVQTEFAVQMLADHLQHLRQAFKFPGRILTRKPPAASEY